MNRLLIVVFICSIEIYSQLLLGGGLNYGSYTAGAFKNLKMDNNKYSYSGYFINVGTSNMSSFLQYSEKVLIVTLNNKNYKLSDKALFFSFGHPFEIRKNLTFSVLGEFGGSFFDADTPLKHSGITGLANLVFYPAIQISDNFNLYAMAKLMIGYIRISGNDPNPYSLDPVPSSNGLLSGPEIGFGFGVLF